MARRYIVNDFIIKSSKKHLNKYSYDKVIYINSRTKVLITCPIHGDFLQAAADHLAGCGCKLCKFEKIGNLKRKSLSTFISESKSIHNNIMYDYSLVEYKNAKTKVKIICPIDGEFLVSPEKHIEGKGCPTCQGHRSQREQFIFNILSKSDFYFEEQKTFPDLYLTRKCYKLKYDFWIPEKNLLLEYDGPHHFEVTHGGDFETLFDIQHRDKVKNHYAKDNGIHLTRIPYWLSNDEIKLWIHICLTTASDSPSSLYTV